MAKLTEFVYPPQGHIAPLIFDSVAKKWYAIKGSGYDYLQVDVQSSDLPDGAATQTTLAAILTELGQKLETADLNLDGTKDLQVDVKTMPTTTVQASGGDKLLSFESIVEEQVSNTNLPGADYTLTGATVPEGKIWRILQAAVLYVGTAPSKIVITASGLASDMPLLEEASPTSGVWVLWNGETYLQYPDKITGILSSCTATDDAYLRYAGVQMDAP